MTTDTGNAECFSKKKKKMDLHLIHLMSINKRYL